MKILLKLKSFICKILDFLFLPLKEDPLVYYDFQIECTFFNGDKEIISCNALEKPSLTTNSCLCVFEYSAEYGTSLSKVLATNVRSIRFINHSSIYPCDNCYLFINKDENNINCKTLGKIKCSQMINTKHCAAQHQIRYNND